MNNEELFNLKLSDEEEALLANYQGCYAEHYDENGLVSTSDTRDPILERLKRRKELKLVMNDVYLKYVPLNKQIAVARDTLPAEEKQMYLDRMTFLSDLYELYKAAVIAETDMDKMYEHMANVVKDATLEFES